LLYTTELLAQTISRFIIVQQSFGFWGNLFERSPDISIEEYFESGIRRLWVIHPDERLGLTQNNQT
jgi:hypothetical protein